MQLLSIGQKKNNACINPDVMTTNANAIALCLPFDLLIAQQTIDAIV